MTEQLAIRRSLPRDRIFAIAQADVERAYGDLNEYRQSMGQEIDGCHMDYELKSPLALGSGPRYVIDAETGETL